jgi:predicted Rossmann fold flavoprotein
MKNVCIIGGGPAGMMAACAAALNRDNRVVLLEKNEKLGKKLYITGKGRCNVTNAADTEDFFSNIIRNPKFLYSALYTFTSADLTDFFQRQGLALKTERGGRVFPESDKSSDVNKALARALEKSGVTIRLNTRVEGLALNGGRIRGVVVNGVLEEYDSVILATGGLSYPLTGSTGDGYAFAKAAGHAVTDLYPSLVPLETEGDTARELAGVSLKNVGFKLVQKGKPIFDGMGEMLFTHFGISGPLVLTASAYIDMKDKGGMTAEIDLKPALDEATLDRRILRDFAKYANKELSNALQELLIRRMIPAVLGQCGIDPEKKAHSVTAEERKSLLKTLKAFRLKVTGIRPVAEAIITRGGVSVKEVDASTMQSKRIQGLFFAGEVLDTDALTGGFNLQIAFSTGYLAGLNA